MPRTSLIRNHGLIPETQLFAKDWRFGGASGATKTVLRADGQYTEFLPEAEYQIGVYMDTLACVSFSALNCLETIMKVNGHSVNYSDRFTAKQSGTSHSGNSLRNVAECIRTQGVVDEDIWPYPRTRRQPIFTWDDYYQEIPSDVIMEGKRWLVDWDVDWEWVDIDLITALQFGPIQVTVLAWPKPVNGLYTDGGNSARNHAVTLVGYEPDEFWIIFDHYDLTVKRLAWDYRFGSPLQFSITHKDSNTTQTPMPTITLPNDILVQETEVSGTFGIHLNNKIILGDEGKLLATWLMRNSGDVKNKAIPIKQSDWLSFPKCDLKNNPIQ